MSIQSEIDRINNAKTSITNSIKSKGVDVPDGTTLDNLPKYVDDISASGGVADAVEWDNVQNKPFTKVGTPDTLTWDGVVGDKFTIGNMFIMCSTATPTAEDLSKGFTFKYTTTDGETVKTFDSDGFSVKVAEDGTEVITVGTLLDGLAMIFSQDTVMDGNEAKKGTYFFNHGEGETFVGISLTINEYTGFVREVIKEEALPPITWDTVKDKPFTKTVTETDTFIPSEWPMTNEIDELLTAFFEMTAPTYKLPAVSLESLMGGAILTISTPEGIRVLDDTKDDEIQVYCETIDVGVYFGVICGGLVFFLIEEDTTIDGIFLPEGLYFIWQHGSQGMELISLKLYNGTFTKTVEKLNKEVLLDIDFPKGWADTLIDWEFKFDPDKPVMSSFSESGMGTHLQRVGDYVPPAELAGKKIVLYDHEGKMYIEDFPVNAEPIAFLVMGMVFNDGATGTMPSGVYMGYITNGETKLGSLGIYDPAKQGNSIPLALITEHDTIATKADIEVAIGLAIGGEY